MAEIFVIIWGALKIAHGLSPVAADRPREVPELGHWDDSTNRV
jgi:hypothetical protein